MHFFSSARGNYCLLMQVWTETGKGKCWWRYGFTFSHSPRCYSV